MDELMITHPRRKSIDIVHTEIRDDFNQSGPQFKQQVITNMWKTDQLNSEIQDLKLQNKYLSKKVNEPAGNGVGSPLKRDDLEDNEMKSGKLITFEGKGPGSGLSADETIHRMLTILRKLLNPFENTDRFINNKSAPAETLKEIMFEISCKIDDQVMQIKKLEAISQSLGNQQRASSQESAEQANYLSAIRSNSPASQNNIVPQLLNQNRTADKVNPFNQGRGGLLASYSQENISHYASTADITLILDEREKKLQIKEELFKCKEQIMQLTNQNERL